MTTQQSDATRDLSGRARYLRQQHEWRMSPSTSPLPLLDDLATEQFLDRLRYYQATCLAVARWRAGLPGEERVMLEAVRRVFRVPLRIVRADVDRLRPAQRPDGRPRLRVVR